MASNFADLFIHRSELLLELPSVRLTVLPGGPLSSAGSELTSYDQKPAKIERLILSPSAPTGNYGGEVDLQDPSVRVLPIISIDNQISIPLIPQLKAVQDDAGSFFFPTAGYKLELLGPSLAMKSRLEELLAFYIMYEHREYRNKLVIVEKDTGRVVGSLDEKSWETCDVPADQDKTDLVTLKLLSSSDATAPALYPDLTISNQEDSEQPPDLPPRSLDVAPPLPKRQSESGLPEPSDKVPKKTLDNMAVRSESLSKKMVEKAEHLGKAITSGAHVLKTKIQPNEKPLKLSASLKSNIKSLRSFSAVASSTSSKYASGILNKAKKVGEHVFKMLASSKSQSVKDVHYVLAQSLFSACTIMDGIEQSIKIILKQSGEASIELVQHKYGDEAKEVFSDAQNCFTNLVLVYYDVRGLGRKAVLKTMGKTVLLR